MADQCPPGFTEYDLGISAENPALDFMAVSLPKRSGNYETA